MANIRFSNKQLTERYTHIVSGNIYYHRNGDALRLPSEKDMLWKTYRYGNKDYLISNCMVVYKLNTKEIPKLYFNGDKPILKNGNNERILSDVVNELFGDNSRVREFRLSDFNNLRVEL